MKFPTLRQLAIALALLLGLLALPVAAADVAATDIQFTEEEVTIYPKKTMDLNTLLKLTPTDANKMTILWDSDTPAWSPLTRTAARSPALQKVKPR
ncbi:MAG: hypothetical protein IJC43_06120 [Clostridia bacterium]|nr:hypothetical protein [Clostridia bacterium]